MVGPEAGFRCGYDGVALLGPAGTPLSLTLSGNEITDAVRAAGVSGDGLSPEGSMGIWEASTNYTLNGGCESGISNVGGNGSASIERTTALAKFGVACLKVTTGGVAGAEGANFSGASGAAAEGQTWTVSAWVRHAEAGPVDLAIRVSWRTTGDALISESQSAPVSVASGEWTKLSLTSVAPATTDRVRVKPVTSGTQAIVFYVDGVQSEQQPLATPYVETDGGTASRSASRVQVPVANVLDETQGWVAMRVRYPWGTSNEPGQNADYLFAWRDDVNNRIIVFYNESDNKVKALRVAAGTGATHAPAQTAPSAGYADTIIFKWAATTTGLSLAGSAFNSAADANVPTLSATTFDIGSQLGLAGSVADIDFFWFACGTGTLSDADAAAIHANGNSDPSPGLFPSAADLTMIAKMIDGTARIY